jgi:hypothetical protein
MVTDKKLKEAVLGYMTVLGVDEFQEQLSSEEREIGAKNIMGCLFEIEDRLYEQGDQTSLSLVDTIRAREEVNGRIHDTSDSRLVESTRYCAEQVFNFYVDRCR